MSKIPNPVQVGLPDKFHSWRSTQEAGIVSMLTSKKRFVSLSAPTGWGKSPAYVAYALLTDKPTCFITNSKGLQDQLLRDYSSIGMVDIRGKSNYPCALREDYTCQDGSASGCPFKGTINCIYSRCEMRATISKLVVTNYDKWISSRLQPNSWISRFEHIVLDEGHDAPEAVARAMQITLAFDDVERVLKLNYPMSVESFPCWKVWACHAREVAVEVMKDWEVKVFTETAPKVSWVRQYIHVKKLVRQLSILATGHPNNWVVEEKEDRFVFDPIRPGRYAEGVLFNRVPHVVIVSATLRPKTMYMLGVNKADYDFLEYDSEFDSKRCPVYYVPTMRVDVRALDLSQLWARLDQILARRQDRKGLIHTISYQRQQDVLTKSRFRGKMMVNARGEAIVGCIGRFRDADPGTILVSPSVSTGFDFPGKDAEYQFICKIPFPDGRSKINKARQEDDKEYGPYSAMQEMVQAAGRIMRSKDDQGETFIGDDHLQWFLPRYAHLAPKAFHSHFRRVEVIPAPPVAL